MGKKSAGRKINNLPPLDYVNIMGGEINSSIKNTGISFTNHEVVKYFKLLRSYALNRIRWTSDTIPEHELRLIEWNIFHYGKCAMLRPKIIKNNVNFRLSTPKIYRCAYTDINYRTLRPTRISIVNQQSHQYIIDVNYNFDEFVIFTDEFLNAQDPMPFVNIAWEYACKLHELDLAFNANSHRNRMPFVFNNAGLDKIEKDGIFAYVADKGVSIAEIMRSAYGRNEQFVEIPESMVGRDGFMHEPRYVKNDMLDHIDAQRKLYESYLELLGLYTLKEVKGVYTIKDIQSSGDETGDFITDVYKRTRILCAKEASKMFNINLTLEVI